MSDKVILVSGKFDLLHKGHIKYLMSARKKAKTLIVSIDGDQYAKSKGYDCVVDLQTRKRTVECLKIADMVVLEQSDSSIPQTVRALGVDEFHIGEDHKGKYDDLDCKVVYTKREKGYDSSKLRELLE